MLTTNRTAGNPVNRRRGAEIRARLLALLRSGPTPLDAACATVGVSRTNLLNHLAALRMAGLLADYSTGGGVVRATMMEDR